MKIEYVPATPEYEEYRSWGWYAVDRETGESHGPFSSKLEAEYAAGRPEEEDD